MPTDEVIPDQEAIETCKRIASELDAALEHPAPIDYSLCECRNQGASVRCGNCGIEQCLMNQ